MDVTVYEQPPARDLNDLTLFDDLGLSATYTGHSTDDIGYVLHFDGTLTDAEVQKVRERVYYTAAEEDMRNKARAAINDNNDWRNNVHPQVISGADQIIAAAGSSAQEKELARAVKTLANQTADLCAQNNALIRLVVKTELAGA